MFITNTVRTDIFPKAIGKCSLAVPPFQNYYQICQIWHIDKHHQTYEVLLDYLMQYELYLFTSEVNEFLPLEPD